MSACIDTNPATDALAKILYELIDLGVGGGSLADAAREVETLFKRADLDFGKWTLEKLDVLRIQADSSTACDLYRALQKITKLTAWNMAEGCDAFHAAVEIANKAMLKARGESEVEK